MNGRRFRKLGLLVGMTVLVTGLTLPASLPAAAAEAPDQVLAWNRYAYHELFVVNGQPPPVAFLNLAMMHAAMYDAVNGIDGSYEPYLGAPAGADPSDSKNAAAAEAAYRVLLAVVPSPSAQLTTDYNTSIAAITSAGETGIAGGQEVGQAAASAIVAARAGDNRTTPTAFSTGTDPGDWQAFSGNNFRWMANLSPFLIQDAEDFATKGPRALDSAEYAAEFRQVKTLGRKTGSTRTEDQTEAALFWADNAIAMWTRIFQDLAEDQDLSTVEGSRFFAMLYLTGTDALIACFLDKELHGFWRPQTAIRNAGTDGNANTTADAAWESLLVNPPYPDHPSGHTCASGSIVATLQDFFGTDEMSFGATHATLGIHRTFTSFSDAIREIRKARVWGGLHFMSADSQGATLGRKVANDRQGHYFQPA
jgi:hypothetical protein